MDLNEYLPMFLAESREHLQELKLEEVVNYDQYILATRKLS